MSSVLASFFEIQTLQLLNMKIAEVTILIIGVVLWVDSTQVVFFEPNVVRREINEDIIPRHDITDCDQDEVIRLSWLGLTMILDMMVNSSSIKSVLLNNNELTTISLETFAEAPQLECLNLAGNRITLDAFQNGHPRLKKLILDYQRLPELSNTVSEFCSSLGPFPNLISLSLKGNDRSCFEVIPHQYPSLSDIDLADNHLESINLTEIASGGKLPLRNIHLERNKFEQLYLNDIDNVEAVYLDGNPLSIVRIHESNANLRILSLANCYMSAPMDGRLYAPSVTMLNLAGNRIRELTVNAFEHTPYLERLNLSNNELRVFPDLSQLVKLQRLSLNFNSIGSISTPIKPSSLIALSLRGNGISVISVDAFSELEQLQELDLAQNRLRMLPHNWHFGMPMLHALNVEWNVFDTIFEMNVHMLFSLRTLQIKGNSISLIDVDTLQSLPEHSVLYVS